MSETFDKKDTGKPQFELLPIDLLAETNTVLQFGAKKYGVNNWRHTKDMRLSRCYNALLRHMIAWWFGEDTDKETGLSHLSHAMCNILFLMYHFKYNKESDDRPIGGNK